MGSHLSKIKAWLISIFPQQSIELDVIDMIQMRKKWEEEVKILLSDKRIKLHFDPEIILHPWILICEAELIDDWNIDVDKTISKHTPTTNQPGMVIFITDGGNYDYKQYHSDPRIKYVTFADFDFTQLFRVKIALKSFIEELQEGTDIDKYVQKEGGPAVTDMETTEGSIDKTSIDSTVDRPDSLEMVKQCLLKFLLTNFPDSSGRFSIDESSRPETNLYQFLFSSTGGKPIECVVHHIDRAQVHIIVGKKGISDNLVINSQAQEGIQKFLQENPSDEIDVIQEIEDELVLVYLKIFLHEEMKAVNFNFHKTKIIPKRPWILLCDTFDKPKYLKQMEMSKDYKSMVLQVFTCNKNIPLKATIRYITNGPAIHLILRNSEIDDSLYIHDCAKDELRRIEESITTGNIADNNVEKGKVKSKDVSSKHQKRVYIKCTTNLPRRAFSNFIERYLPRIKPIWMTGEKSAEKGSLCIVVCFNLSRLRDEIAAVLTDASQDCKNMLVVIQNCREGMSPKPMLRSNPSDKVIDFTNILYDDGECYDCGINYEAREKVQAFIDNN